MKLKLRNNWVLVRLDFRADMTSGGLYIPDSGSRQNWWGTAIQCGPGRYSDDGRWMPMEIQPGARVIVGPYNGYRVDDSHIKQETRDGLNFNDGHQWWICSADGLKTVPDIYVYEHD